MLISTVITSSNSTTSSGIDVLFKASPSITAAILEPFQYVQECIS